MKEEYKNIEGYEGLYQVSNLGNVKSLGNGNSNASKEKILKPAKDKKGYLHIGLSKQGKRKMYLVHRLVAMAFINNPNNFTEINHKNEIKTDNRVENLEYCTTEYNNNYGTRNIRAAKSNTNNPKQGKKVLCLETGVIYYSARDVERQLGFDNSNISKCCNGIYKQAYSFHWKYVS